MPATSLADWLRAESDDALAELLRSRRDLSTPPPSDSTVLASRAGTPGSIARACEDLDTRTLAVLEACLRGRALAWGPGDALRVAPTLRDVLGPFPAGLGASVPALDADALSGLDEDELGVVKALAAGPPIGRTRDAGRDITLERAETPVQRLLARGLLLRRDDQTVELPRELGVALRGGSVFAPGSLTEPTLPVHPHQTSTVDKAAGGEAMEFLRQTESLLRSWSAQPPPVLPPSTMTHVP